MKKSLFLLITFFMGFIAQFCNAQTPAHLYLAGDSTMSIKEVHAYPETGWGMPFAQFFSDKLIVENHAMNGRSTRTFITEGRWKAITDKLKPGDYVIIQFGHNDEFPSKAERYTTPEQYKTNLRRFVGDVRGKKATPILMSPIIRRYFEKAKIIETHPYSKYVHEVAAKDKKLTFIDLEKITHDYFEAMGDENSSLRFLHLKPNLHPNYPFGVRDDTHLNELGAREVAQLVLTELKRIKHPIIALQREATAKNRTKSYQKTPHY